MAGLIALGVALKSFDFEGWAHWIDFNGRPDARWYQGVAGFMLFGALFTALGGPRQVVAFFGAYFFGGWEGFGASMAAAGLSCALVAGIASVFRKGATDLIRGRVDLALQVWRENAFLTTVMIRLLPFGSNLLTNVAAGAARIPYPAFVAGSILGYVPQMAIFALLGMGVDVGSQYQVALSIVLFAVLILISLWIYGRYRRRLTGHGDDQLGGE